MDNEAKEERRQFPRYPFKEEILINGISNAYSLNICEDGMFVCTLISPEKGSILNLTIASELTVKAEVKHHQPGIGMGVQFVDLTRNQEAKIKHIIEDLKG